MEHEQIAVRPVRSKDRIPYQCRQCGACCRQARRSVMVESLDAYRIVRWFREKGDTTLDLDSFYARYTEPVDLTAGYPVYTLKTKGAEDACIFLEDNHCSIYPVRTRTCRLYPFSIAPGNRGRDFIWYQCLNIDFHFSGSTILVKDWLYQNFTGEDRTFVKREFDSMPRIGKYLQELDENQLPQAILAILHYRYENFDLDAPFLPQYDHNTEMLLDMLRRLAGGERSG